MLNPNLLKAFIAVIENGSMNRAAKAMNCSQSTISRLIEQFEDETGLTLFERSFTSRRLILTDQGRTIERRVRHTLSVNEDLYQFCQSLSMDAEVEMRIALPPLLKPEFTRHFCSGLVSAFPHTRFTFLEPSLFEIQSLIQKGECDVGINVFIAVAEEGIGSVGIGALPACFVCHPEHKMYSDQALDMGHLDKETQISFLMPEGEEYKEELNYSSTVIEAATLEQTMLLAGAGLGYAVIPQHLLAYAQKEHGLVRLKSELDARLLFPVHGLFRQADAHRPVTRWIRSYLSNNQF